MKKLCLFIINFIHQKFIKVLLPILFTSTSLSGMFIEGYFHYKDIITLFLSMFFTGIGFTTLNLYPNQFKHFITSLIFKSENYAHIISRNKPIIFGIILCLLGILLISVYSIISFLLSIILVITYFLIYIPLRNRTYFSLPINAIAIAFPVLIGAWGVAPAPSLSAVLLFLGQFAWQLPHIYLNAILCSDNCDTNQFNLIPSIINRLDINFQAILSSLIFTAIVGNLVLFFKNFNFVFLIITLMPLAISSIFAYLFFRKNKPQFLLVSLVFLYLYLCLFHIAFFIFYRNAPLPQL